MTEKERTNFFFFFARVCVYPMMRFFVTFEAKKSRVLDKSFRENLRTNAQFAFRTKDERETIDSEISHREKR